jgi:hypothetical protein
VSVPPEFTTSQDINSYSAVRHSRSNNWVISHGRVQLFEFTDEELEEFVSWLDMVRRWGVQ